MPQIYDMGPTALLPLRRKACWGFFTLKIRRLRPGLNPRTWVLKASTLPLDHRSRSTSIMCYKLSFEFIKETGNSKTVNNGCRFYIYTLSQGNSTEAARNNEQNLRQLQTEQHNIYTDLRYYSQFSFQFHSQIKKNARENVTSVKFSILWEGCRGLTALVPLSGNATFTSNFNCFGRGFNCP